MTQRELKQKLYELVSSYFGNATVTWGRINTTVSPHAPQVVLTMGTLQRPYRPITTKGQDAIVYSYPSKTTLQVDLYTKGASLNSGIGVMSAAENTAVDDLTDFVNFINSVDVNDWNGENDVSILANTVNDLTELINDSTWDYRAMVELEIGFTQRAAGHSGIMWDNGIAYDENGVQLTKQPEFEHTPSGGRTQELAGKGTGWFEQVEIQQEEMEE